MDEDADDMLEDLLEHIRPTDDELSNYDRVAEELREILDGWQEDYLLDTPLSGSLAKRTARRGADVDLFLSVSGETDLTIEGLYFDLFDFLESKGFEPREQNVSAGLEYEGVPVDLIPARRIPGNGDKHWLYWAGTNGVRIQTDIELHVTQLEDIEGEDLVLLAKIWRDDHGLDCPSFLLERAAYDSLYDEPPESLSSGFRGLMSYLGEFIEYIRVVDPGNGANCLSDELSQNKKTLLARCARRALKAESWEEVIPSLRYVM